MSTFRRVEYSAYGGRDKLHVATAAMLTPERPTDVVVRVAACSLNPVDYKIRNGAMRMVKGQAFPAGIGYDAAGEVVSVGASVTKWKVGDRVVLRSKTANTVGEYAVAGEDVVAYAPRPDKADAAHAAAIPLAGMTALQALRRAGCKPGDRVLITGASGGVGHFAVQLAKRVFKASHVTATASPKKFDFVTSLGADEVVDYKDKAKLLGLAQFDVVFDAAGEAVTVAPLLKPGRTVVSVAATPDNFPGANMLIAAAMWFMSRHERNAAAKAQCDYTFMWLNPNTTDLTELVAHVNEGVLTPHVDVVVDGLDKFDDAFERIESGHATGKVVIAVQRGALWW